MADENSWDTGLTVKEEMESHEKNTWPSTQRSGLKFTCLCNTDAKFGSLLNVEGLCYGAGSDNFNKFKNLYSTDIKGQQLYEEILDRRIRLSSQGPDAQKSKGTFERQRSLRLCKGDAQSWKVPYKQRQRSLK